MHKSKLDSATRAKLRVDVMRDEIKQYREFVLTTEQRTDKRMQLGWLIVSAGLAYGLVQGERLVLVLLPFPLMYLVTLTNLAWSTVELRWAYLRRLEAELSEELETPSLAAGVKIGEVLGELRSFHFTTIFFSVTIVALSVVSLVLAFATYGWRWSLLVVAVMMVFAALAALAFVENRRIARTADQRVDDLWRAALSQQEGSASCRQAQLPFE